MRLNKEDLILYGVTDRGFLKNESLDSQVEESLKGGVTCIQLREKDLDYDTFLQEALKLKDLCQKYKALFIVNDNVDIAIKSKADGIHIGQDDMEITQVRKLVGKDMIIGLSVQSVEQAVLAEKMGADYLGVGAVFPTGSKKDAIDVPLSTLKEITDAVKIPVVAIGGINKNNMSKLMGSGICGVALISAIYSASDIKSECEELRKMAGEII